MGMTTTRYPKWRLGDTLTLAVIKRIAKEDDIWLCERCMEIIFPSEYKDNYQFRFDYNRGLHTCRSGERGSIIPIDIDMELRTYVYSPKRTD